MAEINWQELAYTLFEEAGDALILFDPETEEILDVNPMAQSLSGFSRRELLKFKVTYLFRSESPGGMQRLRQAFRRTGLFHSQEGFLLRHEKGGVWIPVNLTITRLHTETSALGLITARDIRERRETLERIRKMEAELRRVTSSVSDCLWSAEVDSAGHWSYCYFSPVVERMTGRPPEFFLSSPSRWLDIVHPEDRLLWQEAFERFRSGQSGAVEYRICCQDGAERWLHDSVMVTSSDNGASLLLDGIISDITERKLADEALRQSESRLRLLIEQTPAILWTTDTELRITSSVGAGLAKIGYRPNETVGMPLYEIMQTNDPEHAAINAHLRALRGESVSYEYCFRDRDFQVHIEPLRDTHDCIIGSVGVALDFTERKAAELALRESQRTLATLMSNLPGLAYRCRIDKNWTMEFVSEGTIDLTGYQPDDFIGNRTLAFADLIHEDDRDMVWNEVQAALAENRPFRLLYRLKTATGEWKWVWEQGRGIVGASGQYEYLEGFITDISDRKRFEEALQRSEAKYRTLVENLTQAIFLKDRDLRLIAVNKPFCESVGKTAEEIIGKTDFDLFPPTLAEKHQRDDRRVLAEGIRLEIEEQRTIAGKTRTVQVVKSPVQDADGNNIGVLGIFWDVTEQRLLENQLRQAQKMDAIGKLAGGIAHDFNNLLTAIIGNLELLRSETSGESPAFELLTNAIKASIRASDLTRQLLSFARQTPLLTGPVNINESIEETVKLLRRTIDPRISIETDLEPHLWQIRGDAAQIGQVLMNLCLNARDAMPEGGRLVLATTNIEITPRDLRSHMEGRCGQFVRLTVSDNGIGMPPEVREHLFEPFFTTKETGKGTGLGLAVVFGIVSQHKGWIECQSEPGKGTRFDIFLPKLLSQSQDRSHLPSHVPEDVEGGHERILLVDDHELIRKLGQQILSRKGYDVITADDGPEAVEIYKQQHENIDLVIVDMTMPSLSGQEVLAQLKQIDPKVRVLFSSGFSTDEAIKAVQKEGAIGFVPKPYRPDGLARAVRHALDRDDTN
ncbi:MAG: hypothetical protein KatS3mg105_1144 [Gemmatales bacterium]|nr:MAG: hypothetical protein KatS3mg105_1144 [Gemmatales bacterium]